MAQLQGMLFVLEVSDAGRLFSVHPDGSHKVVIVTGCRLPDGVVVDDEAGHVYWTNMGDPSVDDGSIATSPTSSPFTSRCEKTSTSARG